MTLPREPRQVIVDPLNGTKKRRVMTSELIGKFRSKSDFIKYLTENRKHSHSFSHFSVSVQLMVPPSKIVNKGKNSCHRKFFVIDFLKQVFRDEKKLLPLNEVKYVHVPHYDELSVKKFWPIFQEDETFMAYMPNPSLTQRIPERDYFWNVANTI